MARARISCSLRVSKGRIGFGAVAFHKATATACHHPSTLCNRSPFPTVGPGEREVTQTSRPESLLYLAVHGQIPGLSTAARSHERWGETPSSLDLQWIQIRGSTESRSTRFMEIIIPALRRPILPFFFRSPAVFPICVHLG